MTDMIEPSAPLSLASPQEISPEEQAMIANDFAEPKVEAEDQATMVHYSTTTDDIGGYHLVGLPVGQYALTVEQPGFRNYRQTGITLRLADRTGLREAAPTVRDLRRTSSGKNSLLCGRALLGGHREPDGWPLLRDDEYLHGKRHSNSYPGV